MTSIAELFANQQAKLVTELFSPVSHGTTKGDTSEAGWRKLLQSFLPGRYRVATGSPLTTSATSVCRMTS